MGWSSFKDKSPWGTRSRSRERPPGPSQIGTAVWGFWGLLVPQHSLSPRHALRTPGGGHPGSAISRWCKRRPKKVCIPG